MDKPGRSEVIWLLRFTFPHLTQCEVIEEIKRLEKDNKELYGEGKIRIVTDDKPKET